jgi:hypothetical protein
MTVDRDAAVERRDTAAACDRADRARVALRNRGPPQVVVDRRRGIPLEQRHPPLPVIERRVIEGLREVPFGGGSVVRLGVIQR